MNVPLSQLLQIVGAAHIKIALLEEEVEQLKRQLAEKQDKKKKNE